MNQHHHSSIQYCRPSWPGYTVLCLLILLLPHCTQPEPKTCNTFLDCQETHACQNQQCIAKTNLDCGSLGKERKPAETCCPIFRDEACQQGYFCAAFDENTEYTCLKQGSRQDLKECYRDAQCQSGSCHEKQRRCRSQPQSPCDPEVGCVLQSQDKRWLCAQQDTQGNRCTEVKGMGKTDDLCSVDDDCIQRRCQKNKCAQAYDLDQGYWSIKLCFSRNNCRDGHLHIQPHSTNPSLSCAQFTLLAARDDSAFEYSIGIYSLPKGQVEFQNNTLTWNVTTASPPFVLKLERKDDTLSGTLSFEDKAEQLSGSMTIEGTRVSATNAKGKTNGNTFCTQCYGQPCPQSSKPPL
ncbi:MAG: hypothetical protein AAGJ35_02330 [Myxococcota bacterium]